MSDAYINRATEIMFNLNANAMMHMISFCSSKVERGEDVYKKICDTWDELVRINVQRKINEIKSE